mmetsp:Transcript_10746/g.19102  ORF Transcript_10746/g.19102 Transcript_10746/m.19102 type:complete len:249 (-) Transcript_10746:894-1640(-)
MHSTPGRALVLMAAAWKQALQNDTSQDSALALLRGRRPRGWASQSSWPMQSLKQPERKRPGLTSEAMIVSVQSCHASPHCFACRMLNPSARCQAPSKMQLMQKTLNTLRAPEKSHESWKQLGLLKSLGYVRTMELETLLRKFLVPRNEGDPWRQPVCKVMQIWSCEALPPMCWLWHCLPPKVADIPVSEIATQLSRPVESSSLCFQQGCRQQNLEVDKPEPVLPKQWSSRLTDKDWQNPFSATHRPLS